MAEKIKMYRFPLRDKFRYAKNANIGLHSIITIFLWQYNGEEWIFLSFLRFLQKSVTFAKTSCSVFTLTL